METRPQDGRGMLHPRKARRRRKLSAVAGFMERAKNGRANERIMGFLYCLRITQFQADTSVKVINTNFKNRRKLLAFNGAVALRA